MASKRAAVPVRVTILTLDAHFAEAFTGARRRLARDLPGLSLSMHVAAEYADDATRTAAAIADIAAADIIIAGQLFTEESAGPVKAAIAARRAACDAVCAMLCVNDVVKLTRLGKYSMADEDRSTSAWSPLALLKKLRGERTEGRSAGERQLAALKRLPKLLRFIPGTAQDVRSWFLAMQYWLAGSEENLANLVRMLVNRYATGPRAALKGALTVGEPVEYPEVGCYHPDLPGLGLTEELRALPVAGRRGRVGLLVGRSYLLAGNTAHYDAVIRALEGHGLAVIPAFASGLDAREAITRFFMDDGRRDAGRPMATIDALVSLTGFSLVGAGLQRRRGRAGGAHRPRRAVPLAADAGVPERRGLGG